MSTGILSILTVCTGNICRSPLAEQLLRLRLDAQRFTVSSAGTMAIVGDPMDPEAAEQSRLLGANPDGFVSRQLRGGLIVASDLVLTATIAHRELVVRDYPRAAGRVFTLAEFARIGVSNIDEAARLRVTSKHKKGDDIVDPYARGQRVHAASAAQTHLLTDRVAQILSGSAH